MFVTRKMKNTTMCTGDLRHSFALSRGRMRSIPAPVVPMNEASTEPMSRMSVLTMGVPTRVPLSRIPPEIMNSAARSAMNAM